jgi:hypothetical protein
MATIKNTDNKCWLVCGEKGTFIYFWCEYKLVQPPWRTVWRFLRKIKVELPYDLANLGISQRNVSQVTIKASAHPYLLQHYSQQLNYGNSQDASLLINGLRK